MLQDPPRIKMTDHTDFQNFHALYEQKCVYFLSGIYDSGLVFDIFFWKFSIGKQISYALIIKKLYLLLMIIIWNYSLKNLKFALNLFKKNTYYCNPITLQIYSNDHLWKFLFFLVRISFLQIIAILHSCKRPFKNQKSHPT